MRRPLSAVSNRGVALPGRGQMHREQFLLPTLATPLQRVKGTATPRARDTGRTAHLLANDRDTHGPRGSAAYHEIPRTSMGAVSMGCRQHRDPPPEPAHAPADTAGHRSAWLPGCRHLPPSSHAQNSRLPTDGSTMGQTGQQEIDMFSAGKDKHALLSAVATAAFGPASLPGTRRGLPGGTRHGDS